MESPYKKVIEVSYKTTLYFEVPDGYTALEYITKLSNNSKLDMIKLATDVGDGGWGVDD
jgi:hypothetical protein